VPLGVFDPPPLSLEPEPDDPEEPDEPLPWLAGWVTVAWLPEPLPPLVPASLPADELLAAEVVTVVGAGGWSPTAGVALLPRGAGRTSVVRCWDTDGRD
jgi:hypothetical protein